MTVSPTARRLCLPGGPAAERRPCRGLGGRGRAVGLPCFRTLIHGNSLAKRLITKVKHGSPTAPGRGRRGRRITVEASGTSPVSEWVCMFEPATISRAVAITIGEVARSSIAEDVAFVRDPHTWTVLQKYDPDYLGLRCNRFPTHQMALITSGCVPFRWPAFTWRRIAIGETVILLTLPPHRY